MSKEAAEQPSEDGNSNEDDEEIVISQNDTNLKATTREQVNRYVEEGASLENDIIQHESLPSKNDNAGSQTLFQRKKNSPSLMKRTNYLCALLNAIELENGPTYWEIMTLLH